MHLWTKHVEPRWLNAREDLLQARFGSTLSITSEPGRKRSRLEIACKSRTDARNLVRQFGGSVRKLRRDWLERFTRAGRTKPLKIGKRLVVIRSSRPREAVSFSYRLVIPAGLAFGTGEHATTAMSLRLLEQFTRQWKSGWSIVDLGTGSGILALAATRFGARRIWGIDSDVTAISTARGNARINKIRGIKFLVADVRRWKSPAKIDIVTANLFSELLIELLPKLGRANWLVLSGILRAQEKEFAQAMRRNKIDIVEARRRGKWIAIVGRGRGDSSVRPSGQLRAIAPT